MIEYNYTKKKLNNSINKIMLGLTISFICIIVGIVCLFNQIGDVYGLIVILPITYGFVFLFMLYPSIIKNKSYTTTLFTFACALRYVLHPLLVSIYPNYGFSGFHNSDVNSISFAILLMTYELIVCSSMLTYFVSKSKKTDKIKKDRYIGFPDGNGIILVFIVIALIITIISPSVFSKLNFFMLKSNTGNRISSVNSSTIEYITRQIFQIGRLALYIVIVVLCKNKFKVNQKKIYINIALFASILNLGIIIGEARSGQVQFAFAAAYLLSQCFPKQSKRIIRVILLTAGLIIVFMTIYKHFYAFKYDSYLTTISNSKLDMHEVVKTSEVYLLGPLSVSSAMLLKKSTIRFGLERLLYDFARSFMGLNFIAKKIDMQTTTIIYNLFVTNGNANNGYLLPITAQGYLYFGWILSPILLCIFLKLSLFLEEKLKTSESAYTIFFAAYLFIRTSTSIVSSNINTVITNGSMILLSAGIIYMMQKLVPVNLIMSKKRINDRNDYSN